MKRLAIALLLTGFAFAQAPAAAPDAQPKAAPQSNSGTVDANDLLPELPTLDSKDATLVGGTIDKLDRVRNQFVVRPYGTEHGAMKVLFDGRTKVYRDGNKVSARDLRSGDKAYVDTVLDGTAIFAKNIHIVTKAGSGESRGQVVAFDSTRNELTLNDALSHESVNIRILPGTKILRGEQQVSASGLRPGTLVAVEFGVQGKDGAVARAISILAEPGSVFTFAGRVTHLDMHKGFMGLMDPRDNKNYEVKFNPSTVRIDGNLTLDSNVTVNAKFDGAGYQTNAILVSSTAEKN